MAIGIQAGAEIAASGAGAQSIVRMGNGGYAVVWVSSEYGETWGDYHDIVRLQLLDASGAKIGDSIALTEPTAGWWERSSPSVFNTGNGGFAVLWREGASEYAPPLTGYIFDASGTIIAPMTLDGDSDEPAIEPVIAGLEGGGFVATWFQGYYQRTQLYGPDGVGGVIAYEGMNGAQAVAGLRGGGYVIVRSGIDAQLFDSMGQRVGSSFAVNTVTAGSQFEPSVSALANGGFVVTWTDMSGQGDASGSGIKAQLFDAGGAKVGTEFVVNTQTDGDQNRAQVTALSGGGFVVTWKDGNAATGDGSGSSIKAQVFDINGNRIGAEFIVNVTAEGEQYAPTVMATANNGFTIAWAGPSGAMRMFQVTGDPVSGDNMLTGTAGNDVIDGNSGNDTIFGLEGDDSLLGIEHNDSLSGDAGNDTLWGGNGTDSLSGGADNDQLHGEAGNDLLDGGDGDDLLYGDAGLDTLNGGAGRDTLHGAAGDVLNGNGGDDVIQVTGAGSVNGGDGDDVVRSDIGGASIALGAGHDVVVLRTGGSGSAVVISDFQTGQGGDALNYYGVAGIASGSDPLAGGQLTWKQEGGNAVLYAGDQVLVSLQGVNIASQSSASLALIAGTASDDVLSGTNGGDVKDGLAGNDWLRGFSGNDTLRGGAGIDTLEGGNGNDILYADDAFQAGEVYAGNSGTDTLSGYGDLAAISYSGFEALTVRAGGYELKGSIQQLTSFSSLGYDDGGTGGGSGFVLSNGGIADFSGKSLTGIKVRASNANNGNQIKGTQGNDTLVGGANNDILTGGAGDDRYVVGVGAGRGDHIIAGSTGVANDVLEITGALTIDDVRFLRDGNDLFIRYGLASSDSVRLINHFAYDGTTQVRTLEIGGMAYDLTQGLAFNGTSERDYLTGGAFDDSITSHAGDDKIYALAGNDTLKGNTGNDTLDGGAGNDRYLFAIGDGQDLIVTPTTPGDADIIEITTKTLAIDGVRFERSGDDLVIGVGPGTDSLRLASHFTSAVKVSAVIVGGVTYSLVGDSAIGGGSGADTLTGTVMNDTISGYAGADSLDGWYGNDSLLGGERWDTLKGGEGNDTLDGGLDNDQMYGGKGDDLYYVDNAGDRTFELLNEGIDSVISSLSWALAADVEHLTLTGTALTGTGNGLANRIIGNELANTLSGGASADTLDGAAGADSLDGGIGNDSLLGGARWDTLIGGDGNDTLDGGLDNDQMYGGFGDDVYYVDHVGDRVNEATGENQGIDTVYATVSWNMSANIEHVVFTGAANAASIGNSLHNTMAGNAGNNTLVGGSGHDTINGGDGHDSIDGGTESDVLDGGAGNDTILGGQRWDTLVGGDGDDVLDGGTENDRMTGGAGNDTYYIDHIGDRVIEVAGEGIDTVYSSLDWAMAADVETLVLTGAAITGTGNGLNNRMTGNANANVLNGGNGNDTLIGGQGADTLTGGTGRDDFVFSASNGTDRITDFVHSIDRLVFTGVDYGFAGGYRLNAAQFTAGATAVGSGAQFVWDAATGHLYWDADGSGAGAAIDLAVFEGAPGLTKDDFYFV